MSDAPHSKLSISRCTLTGVAVLAVQFAACWAAAAADFFGGSHMYISIFTIAPVASLTALGAGLCWSIIFGGLTGALIAIAYNAFGFLEGRSAPPQRAVSA